MKIVIAPDSFKESLTALEVANAIETGFKRIFPNAEYVKLPMADGGEGTVQSLVDATQGRLIEAEVTAPLGNQVKSFFGLSGDGKTAIIEMLSGASVSVNVKSFQNDTVSFSNKDDVLTYLVHLGYLGYDQNKKMAFVPNEEIRQELIMAVKSSGWHRFVEG